MRFQSAERDDQDKAQLHEQEPRGPFLGANWFPTELLAGINPRACVSAEVFRYPYKQGQTEKAKQEWHFPVFLVRAKIDLRPPISNEDADDQAPADIEGKVVGEEIEVGECGQKYRDSELGEVIQNAIQTLAIHVRCSYRLENT